MAIIFKARGIEVNEKLIFYEHIGFFIVAIIVLILIFAQLTHNGV